MRTAMDVKLVFITTGLGDPARRARSMASWRPDGREETLEYDLEGTPCRLVYDGQVVVVSEGLYKQFPREAGFEGYIGVPLRNREGRPVGHLAVLSHEPILSAQKGEAIVRLFSQRAEAELQRLVHEREREALIVALSRLNRRLSDRHNALREANQTKTVLLGMVAHDLRNPLAAIMGRSELIQSILQAGGAAEKAQENCAHIITSVERMDRLIASALTQAKSEAAQIRVEAAAFPVGRAVEAAVALNSVAAGRKCIAISQDAPPSLMINGDEDRIVEALDNLIGNAVKYCHAGQNIHVSATQNGDGACVLAVTDSGQGLTPEDCDRAFRQFQRLSATPTAGESSTGLGLAIVKAIAEAHGGQARVESKGRGKGATFSLVLPEP